MVARQDFEIDQAVRAIAQQPNQNARLIAPVGESLGAIRIVIETLGRQLEGLEEKLETVLIPEGPSLAPKNQAGPSGPEPMKCALESVIDEYTKMVAGIGMRIDSIMSRCRL